MNDYSTFLRLLDGMSREQKLEKLNEWIMWAREDLTVTRARFDALCDLLRDVAREDG